MSSERKPPVVLEGTVIDRVDVPGAIPAGARRHCLELARTWREQARSLRMGTSTAPFRNVLDVAAELALGTVATVRADALDDAASALEELVGRWPP